MTALTVAPSGAGIKLKSFVATRAETEPPGAEASDCQKRETRRLPHGDAGNKKKKEGKKKKPKMRNQTTLKR